MSKYCSSINKNRKMESLLNFLICAAKSIEKTHVFESSLVYEMTINRVIAGLHAVHI